MRACPHGQLARSCERCDDAREIARLTEQVRVFIEREALKNTCAHCRCDLLPSNDVPHCDDCLVADADEEQYLEALAATEPKR